MTSLAKKSRSTEEFRKSLGYFTENYIKLAKMLGEDLEKTLQELGGEKSFENCYRIFLGYNVFVDLQIFSPYNSGPYVLNNDWRKLDNPSEFEFATIETSLFAILGKMESYL